MPAYSPRKIAVAAKERGADLMRNLFTQSMFAAGAALALAAMPATANAQGWNAYTLEAVKSGASGAAIIGLKDGVVWAADGTLANWANSTDFKAENLAIRDGISGMRANAFRLNGVKYLFTYYPTFPRWEWKNLAILAV
jgi:Profilin